MRTVIRALLLALSLAGTLAAKNIVLVAGEPSHGYGSHEHHAGVLLLERLMKDAIPNIETRVFNTTWPDEETLESADALIIASDGHSHIALPHLDQVSELSRNGMGVMLIHYAVDRPAEEGGNEIREWIGGHYERGFSINPHWIAQFDEFPEHPITRGVEPFAAYDEWYFNMRFQPGMRDVTPILTAQPGLGALMRKDGPHSGNSIIRASVKRGDRHHVAWAYERAGRGRGFGFTGGHYHHNYLDENFRRILLNAAAWVARIEVPEHGLPAGKLTMADIEANQDYPKEPDFEVEHGFILTGDADPVASMSGEAEIDLPLKTRGNPNVFLVTSEPAEWADAWFSGPSGQKAPLAGETVFDALPARNLRLYRTPKGATRFRARGGKEGVTYMVFLEPPDERHLSH